MPQKNEAVSKSQPTGKTGMTLLHEIKILSDFIISLPGMMIHCPEN